MNSSKTIIVATHNAHKVREIRDILSIPDWDFVSLDEMGITEEPEENSDSFIGNARIKAQFAHGKTGLAVLADDSGLEVDALAGAPGVYSSRYAGEPSDDSANNAKLLKELEGIPNVERGAQFVCALVFIDEDGSEITAEGVFKGRIGFAPAGENGFGYDPLFYPESCEYACSSAELSAEDKNAVSHRYKALVELRGKLLNPDAAVEASGQCRLSSSRTTKQQIVAFDFDGTLIDASSPVRLIARLNRDRIMPKSAVIKTMLWGARYKMGMELDQVIPRRHVFSSFRNFAASDANAIMKNLYNEELRSYLRPQALAVLKEHQAAGRHIIIVSASFEPIISEVCNDLDIDSYICTRMEVANGSYTGETICIPPESEHKLTQFTEWANDKFGIDAWELSHAYGDHYSDVPLMETAHFPVAVDPDKRLRKIAVEREWEIVDWQRKQG